MKKVTLIRHGKSSWENYSSDFERQLIAKGVMNSKLIAAFTDILISDKSTIWSSPAVRAKNTCLLFIEEWKLNPDIVNYSKKLYTFDAINLANFIKKSADDVENLIIFGHNNAITDFVNKFGNKQIDNVPTSGFVQIIFDDITWKSIRKGKTTYFITPRQLKNE